MREFHVNQSPEAHYTIYELISPKGKIYIGCTGNRPKRRWRCGRGYSHNIALNGDIEKYGWAAFKKVILCEKLTKKGAEKIEKQLIELLGARDPKKGYNIFTGGERIGSDVSDQGRQHIKTGRIRYAAANPEYIMILSKKCAESASSPEIRAHRRKMALEYIARTGDNEIRAPIPVICIETGTRYPSMMAAERATGISHRGISHVCNGRRRTAGNLHWEFV